MSLCLQLAWRGTLLQVPEVLLRLSCGVGSCELGVSCVWVGQHALLLASLERKCFCCGYLSRRAGFLLLTMQEIGVDGSKPWLTGQGGLRTEWGFVASKSATDRGLA